LGVDATTDTITTIAYPHHEIHSGSHYYIQGYLEMGTTTTPYRMKMVTPNSEKWSHFIFQITGSGITGTTFDEDASGGMASGDSKIPFNNDRNSTQASGVVFTTGVEAASTYATRLEDDKWGAAGFKQFFGGGNSREDELILKQNTTYLRTFTSYSDSNVIQFKASWYEHTNK